MTVNLNSTTDNYPFEGVPGTTRPVSTSGDTGAGTIKLQHRVADTDDWVDNPNMTFTSGTHVSGFLTLSARYNRVYIDGADGTTDVNLDI